MEKYYGGPQNCKWQQLNCKHSRAKEIWNFYNWQNSKNKTQTGLQFLTIDSSISLVHSKTVQLRPYITVTLYLYM